MAAPRRMEMGVSITEVERKPSVLHLVTHPVCLAFEGRTFKI